jgi:hypothetical protein
MDGDRLANPLRGHLSTDGRTAVRAGLRRGVQAGRDDPAWMLPESLKLLGDLRLARHAVTGGGRMYAKFDFSRASSHDT